MSTDTLTTIPIWVAFDNAREYAINSGSPNKILLEYVVNPEVRFAFVKPLY